MQRSLAGLVVVGAVLSGCGGDDQGGNEDETAGETAGDGDTGDGDSGDGDGDGDDPSGDGDADPSGDGDADPTGDGDTEPGPAGIFVAVGDGGRRASSTDGETWAELIGTGTVDTQAEEGEEDILRAIAVGSEPPVLVAVGGGGTDWTGNAMIMRSTDGTTWDEDLVGGVDGVDGRKLTAVAWLPASDAFVAGGHQAHLLRSSDAGQTWTRVYPEHPSDTTVYGIAGLDDGTVVAVGAHKDAWDAPKVAYVHRSEDGGQSFAAPSFFGDDGDQLIAVASDGQTFVAVGPQQCLRSGDGLDWQPCGLTGSGYGAVSFTRDRFVVTYLDGVSTSQDGENWSVHVESSTGVPAEVVFGNGLYMGVRFYDRGSSPTLGEWSWVSQSGYPLRDIAFLPLE